MPSLLLPIALLLGPSHAAPGELTVWHNQRGEEQQAFEALVAEWGASRSDVKVSVLAVPYESFFSKLESASPRGNGPDLFIAAHERIGGWVESGLIAPLTLDAAVAADLHPATLSAMTWQGQVYGVPLAWKCLALFWNRALVDGPPADTDAMRALMVRERAAGRYGLAVEYTAPYFHLPWMHGFGGGVFLGEEVALDQPGNAASLAFLADLLRDDLLPQDPTAALVTQLFNDGSAALVINGPWFLGEISPTVDFGVAPLPVVSATGQPAAPFLTVDGAFVSAYADDPGPAADLARWLASPDVALERARRGKQLVATLSAAAQVDDPVSAAFLLQLDHTVPMPNRPEMALTWEPMARMVRRVARGASEPEVASDQAQTEYRIVSQPVPPASDPRPYLAVFGLLAAVGLGVFGRRAWRARGDVRANAFAYGWIGPAALAMGVLVVLPFGVGAALSLFDHHAGTFTFVGLRNFLDIVLARDWPITSPLSFWYTLVVTVLWTVSNVVLHLVIGVTLAMVLREPWVRLRGLFRVLLILPWAVPNYITALIWKSLFHRQFGAINGLLVWLGLEPVSWFSKFSTAFAANLATNTWLGFPFMMVVTLGALQSIPRELEQAAEVDGASGWQRFRHITLPLLKPALLPAVILGSVWTFNMFNVIYLVSGGEPDGSTEILISEAYRWAFTRNYRYGYAAAYSVLIFFVLLGWSRLGNKLAGQKVL